MSKRLAMKPGVSRERVVIFSMRALSERVVARVAGEVCRPLITTGHIGGDEG